MEPPIVVRSDRCPPSGRPGTIWCADVRPAGPGQHGGQCLARKDDGMPTLTDPHLNVIRPVSPRTPNGCQECLMLGSAWMHGGCGTPTSLRSVTSALSTAAE